MKTVFRGIVSRDGNVLVRVKDGEVRPLPRFVHQLSHLLLPWDWAHGFYGQWAVAYAVLFCATGGQNALASQLACRFAQEVLAQQTAWRWELEEEWVQNWCVEVIGRSLTEGGK